jgi:hypothetical protein
VVEPVLERLVIALKGVLRGGRARLGGALKIDIVSPVLAGEPGEPQADWCVLGGARGDPWMRRNNTLPGPSFLAP